MGKWFGENALSHLWGKIKEYVADQTTEFYMDEENATLYIKRPNSSKTKNEE